MTWDYHPDGKLAARSDDGVPVGLHVVLVDNSDAQNVTFTGAWATAETAGGLFGFDYATSAPGTGQDTAEWTLHIPQDGSYEVFARWPEVTGAATDATYTVAHDAGSTPVAADQSIQPGEWVSLGTFGFTAGEQGGITLTDDADGTVVADAVKLVRDTTGQTDTEAKDLTYEYDVNGNLIDIVDNSSDANVDAYAVSYDGLNRVGQVEELLAGVVQNTTSFTYNQVGAPLTRTHDDSHAAFAYDVRNLLTTVSNGEAASDPDPKVTTYTHTPRGQRATQTKANGNTVTFDYWPDGALREQMETKPDATVVASHIYEYDLNGNRSLDTSRQMNADDHGTYLQRVSAFGYDPRDRLATVTRTDPGTGGQAGSETYTHDANNNVISQTIDGVTTTSVYDRNRLQSTTIAGVASTYNYDPFGRLNTVTAAGQTTQRYVYDGFDRIIEQHTDGTVTQKSYDPLDRTATRTTDAGTAEEQSTEFVYLGLSQQVLAEIIDGQVQTTYQHGITGELLSQTKHDTSGTGAEEDSFYGYNPHGDITGITDQAGNTRATYGYTAYGNDDESLFTGVDKPDPGNPEDQEPYNAYRYAGQRFDAVTGTYDMGFRDYHPGLNRFLTRDMFNGALADLSLTTNPWTLGRYTFAGGNPTTLVEYDGHLAVNDIVGGGGGSSGVPQPTCSDATPEYCHEPGENRTGAWGLGFRWAAVELLGVAACYPNPPCAPTSGPMHTEYFREGDPFTEGIRAHEHIQEVRERIAVELAADQMQGTVHLHYGDPAQFSPEDREEIFWANVDSVLTFGGAGMPIEQAFLGSYDLSWELIGKEAGNPVIEFNLTNASTWNSAKPDPGKITSYTNESASDGHDALAGEWWTRQSIRWRETFPGGVPSGPGAWAPRPGPYPPLQTRVPPSAILKPAWDNVVSPLVGLVF